jgi:hypothetical protein
LLKINLKDIFNENKINNVEYTVKVTVEEFCLIREFSRFLLPHLIGWNLMNENEDYEKILNE